MATAQKNNAGFWLMTSLYLYFAKNLLSILKNKQVLDPGVVQESPSKLLEVGLSHIFTKINVALHFPEHTMAYKHACHWLRFPATTLSLTLKVTQLLIALIFTQSQPHSSTNTTPRTCKVILPSHMFVLFSGVFRLLLSYFLSSCLGCLPITCLLLITLWLTFWSFSPCLQ